MSPSSPNLSTFRNSKESSSPYLPDELLFNCFTRVSRHLYPTLSLVSKRFHSLITSLELYETRKLLKRTETCLYVCLQYSSGQPGWFTLCNRQTLVRNPKPKSQWFTSNLRNKSSDNLLVSVPTHNLPPCFSRSLTTIGSNLYMIGGRDISTSEHSSKVFVMDTRSHTWHEAPSLMVPRKCPLVSVLDGKIYVAESPKLCDNLDLIEVFDTKTEIWEQHVTSPGGTDIFQSLVIRGNLYMFVDKSIVVYKADEKRWDVLGSDMCVAVSGWDMCGAGISDSLCEIDGVSYCYRLGKVVLEWYDYEEKWWKELKGLEGMPKLSKDVRCKLVNYGGKIAVLWEKNEGVMSSKKKIWCAVIALERRNRHEIYGKVEWCNVVLTVPKSCFFQKCVATTV